MTETTLTAPSEDESNLLVETIGVAYVTAATFGKAGNSSHLSESSTTDLKGAVVTVTSPPLFFIPSPL